MSWESLSDVYKNRVAKRQLNEATVHIKFNDTKEDHTFDLEDVYARKVLGFAAYTAHFLDEILVEWVKSGGWSDIAIKRSVEQIQSALLESFDMNDPNIVKTIANDIKRVINHKETNRSFYDFITSGGGNLFNLFEISGLELLNDTNFLSKLVQIDFAENKVSVGPGEMALTLFTEATNPKKGDLHVTGLGEVELKGDLGRIGKGDRERYVFNKFINKATNASSIEKLQQNAFNELIAAKGDISPDILLKFNRVYKHSKIYKVIKSVIDSKNLKDFFTNTKPSDFTKLEVERMEAAIKQLVPEDKNDISLENYKEALSNIVLAAYSIHLYKVGKETRQFRMFFELDSIDDEDKIEAILEYVEDGKLNDNIENIIREFYYKIAPEQLVGSITIANYQAKEDFQYIVFANTGPTVIRSGNMPCKALGPYTNSYENNLLMSINNTGEITFTPNADRGGFQTLYRSAPIPTSTSLVGDTTTGPGESIKNSEAETEADKLNIAV